MIQKRNDDIGTWLFFIDNSFKKNHENYVSTPLLERLKEEIPDLVIFRGLGFRLPNWLLLKSSQKFRFAFIVGGETNDILGPYADYILTETQHQLHDCFPMKYHQSRVSILPKFLSKQALQNNQKKTFDIINVGYFIPLKNQQNLLPLAQDYKIAIVGDGNLYPKIKVEAEPFGDNILCLEKSQGKKWDLLLPGRV